MNDCHWLDCWFLSLVVIPTESGSMDTWYLSLVDIQTNSTTLRC